MTCEEKERIGRLCEIGLQLIALTLLTSLAFKTNVAGYEVIVICALYKLTTDRI